MDNSTACIDGYYHGFVHWCIGDTKDCAMMVKQGNTPMAIVERYIFLIHYICFGTVANFGNATSGPITVHLQIMSPQGAILLSTDGSTIPATLGPKQEGKFTFELTSNDLGGYKSFDWTFVVSVVKQ